MLKRKNVFLLATRHIFPTHKHLENVYICIIYECTSIFKCFMKIFEKKMEVFLCLKLM